MIELMLDCRLFRNEFERVSGARYLSFFRTEIPNSQNAHGDNGNGDN